MSLIDDTTQIYESHEVIMPGFVYEWFKLPDFPLNNGPTNNIYRCFSSIEEIDIHSNFFDDLTNDWFEFTAPKQFYDVINSNQSLVRSSKKLIYTLTSLMILLMTGLNL